jgi:hypothetical protein
MPEINRKLTGDILIRTDRCVLSMKWLAVVLVLIICQGFAQGYPISASNEAVNCTVFGEFKHSYVSTEPNEDRQVILNLDVSLIKPNDTTKSPVQATYFLVDHNDKTYPAKDELTRPLGYGRQILGFAVPPEAIPKMLIVVPYGGSPGGNRLVVNFGELINATNGKVTLLYYGILNPKKKSNFTSIDFDISVINNDVKGLPVSSKNFSLIDQWGWRYNSTAYNKHTDGGFPGRELKPKEMARIKVSFRSMSPLSRPSKLVYEYSNNSSLVLNIGPQAESVTLSNNCSSQSIGNSVIDSSVMSKLAVSLKASRGVIKKGREDFIKENVHLVGGNSTRQMAVLGK